MKRRSFVSGLAASFMLPAADSVLAARKTANWAVQRDEKVNYLRDDQVKDALPVEQQEGQHEDVVFRDEKLALLKDTQKRLKRVQNLVGYANFNLIDYDLVLRYARNYSKVGAFPKAEKDFLEELFFADAESYGFFGDKVTTSLTDVIPRRETIKIPKSGHFLFREESLKMYEQIKKDLGDSVILTSGIRGVVKQAYLFLTKALDTGGNLSRASHSLAPPGHSYHGIGDFDVGKVGYGHRNFTEDFAKTDEFQRLIDLGYVLIRYPSGNPYGVRFEPWHIKVV